MNEQNKFSEIPNQISNDFSREKAMVMDYLVDKGLLDEGVKELVVKFNELPFCTRLVQVQDIF